MAIQQGRNIERLLIIAFLLCALIIAFIIVALGARLRSEIPIAYGYRRYPETVVNADRLV